ncbi:serine/threonine-protein kinase [Sphingomonas sp.]|uniref:serine/threonine protein kinase n=1 Tax=Sphingomonas sp. TaxID=28214 RepID=UPI00286B8174|nr:serine/threonine-protein kinase [Sphingomonas sp.]
MSKAYSNKALPAGTVIREWRLEDVLGVGGFGIVYKGRGISFGELVAIKEYFPSSISERDSESTVVPIGSDVEEVHALGLKKFVEEAKLLWNLSTPTRHPNIVSVRSLFEVHGTAYMVMDFEDGVSLSKLLKDGRRFNERSLWNIVRPIAEGLDRAHRVGVLHRYIKPPNILITDDSRPVLIDFGSARFEAAEATSTTVTFHTPPYAALEQYVKTYPQGPWTDIYALGVVLYECVTGEKPPEVLERMHGSMGTPLAEGTWPGFGKRFLQAIDASMTIRPTERPQSIREWLALFGKKDVEEEISSDEEPTRFFAHEVTAEEIMPVAPPEAGFDQKEPLETQVPKDPGDVQFKRAGEDTGATKRKKDSEKGKEAEPVKVEEEEQEAATTPEVVPLDRAAAAKKKPVGAVRDGAREPPSEWYKKPRVAMLAGGGAVALLAAVAAGSFLFGKGDSNSGYEPVPNLSGPTFTPVTNLEVDGLAPAERSLAEDAQKAGAPATAVSDLIAASDNLATQSAALRTLQSNPKQTAAATAKADEMKHLAAAANVAFTAALLSDAEARARRMSSDANAASQGSVGNALSALRAAVQASAAATDPAQSLNAARDALGKSQGFTYSLQAANRRGAEALAQRTAKKTAGTALPSATERAATTVKPTAAAEVVATPSSTGLSAGKLSQLNATIDGARGLAKAVIRMGDHSSNATRKANAGLAKNYDKYLANLRDSGRGVKSDKEADRLIKEANQTKAYIVFLNKQSSAAQ